MFVTRNVREKRLTYTHNQYFGGYITYFKLYLNFLKLFPTVKSFSNKKQYWKFIFGVIIKTPWWLLIKPLGSVFTVKRFYKGLIYYVNDEVDKDKTNCRKTVTIKFIKIPVIVYPGIMNEKDWDYVSKG